MASHTKLKDLLNEVPDEIKFSNGKSLEYGDEDAIPFMMLASDLVILSHSEYPTTHADIRHVLQKLKSAFLEEVDIQPILKKYDIEFFPKNPESADDVNERYSIDGRLWTESKVISFWENDKKSVEALHHIIPFLKHIAKKGWSKYQLELHDTESQFVPVTKALRGFVHVKTATDIQKKKLEVLKKYHKMAPGPQKDAIRLKLFPQLNEIPTWKKLGYNSEAEYNFKKQQNVAESQQIHETPDMPDSVAFDDAHHSDDRTITFCATKDWIIYGYTSARVYHGTISSFLNEAAIIAIEKLGANWITKVDSMMPFIQEVYKKRPGLKYMIYIIGDVKTDYFKNLVYDCGTLDITGRELGRLNGRLWQDQGILSCWEDDIVVQRNLPILFPLLKQFDWSPDDIKLDLQGYTTFADDDVKDNIQTASQFMRKSKVKKFPKKIQVLLHQLKGRLHSEPSRSTEIRTEIKKLLSKYVGTQDIDVVVDKILDRMLGSEVSGERAQRAGYKSAAEFNFNKDRYHENINLKSLIETPLKT